MMKTMMVRTIKLTAKSKTAHSSIENVPTSFSSSYSGPSWEATVGPSIMLTKMDIQKKFSGQLMVTDSFVVLAISLLSQSSTTS